jgi:hypothetical protein
LYGLAIVIALFSTGRYRDINISFFGIFLLANGANGELPNESRNIASNETSKDKRDGAGARGSQSCSGTWISFGVQRPPPPGFSRCGNSKDENCDLCSWMLLAPASRLQAGDHAQKEYKILGK